MSDLWSITGDQAEADIKSHLVEAALIEAAPYRSIAAKAADTADFQNRLTIIDEKLDKVIAKVVESTDDNFAYVKSEVVREFRLAFNANRTKVQAEAKRKSLLQREVVAGLNKVATERTIAETYRTVDIYVDENGEYSFGIGWPGKSYGYMSSTWEAHQIIDFEIDNMGSDFYRKQSAYIPPDSEAFVATNNDWDNVRYVCEKCKANYAEFEPADPNDLAGDPSVGIWATNDCEDCGASFDGGWDGYYASRKTAGPEPVVVSTMWGVEPCQWCLGPGDTACNWCEGTGYLESVTHTDGSFGWVPALRPVESSRKTAYQSANTNKQRRGHEFQMPQDIQRNIPKTYGTDDIAIADKIVHAHYFSPSGDWYVVEMDDDGYAWGFADLGYGEWGYFDLEELEEVYVEPFGIVERDMHFSPKPVSEIAKIRTGMKRAAKVQQRLAALRGKTALDAADVFNADDGTLYRGTGWAKGPFAAVESTAGDYGVVYLDDEDGYDIMTGMSRFDAEDSVERWFANPQTAPFDDLWTNDWSGLLDNVKGSRKAAKRKTANPTEAKRRKEAFSAPGDDWAFLNVGDLCPYCYRGNLHYQDEDVYGDLECNNCGELFPTEDSVATSNASAEWMPHVTKKAYYDDDYDDYGLDVYIGDSCPECGSGTVVEDSEYGDCYCAHCGAEFGEL